MHGDERSNETCTGSGSIGRFYSGVVDCGRCGRMLQPKLKSIRAQWEIDGKAWATVPNHKRLTGGL